MTNTQSYPFAATCSNASGLFSDNIWPTAENKDQLSRNVFTNQAASSNHNDSPFRIADHNATSYQNVLAKSSCTQASSLVTESDGLRGASLANQDVGYLFPSSQSVMMETRLVQNLESGNKVLPGFSNPFMKDIPGLYPRANNSFVSGTVDQGIELNHFEDGLILAKILAGHQIDVFYRAMQEDRSAERRKLMDEGIIDDPDRRKTLEHAIEFHGTCRNKCPSHEIIQRCYQKMVDPLEQDGDGKADPVRFVKTFHRPAAGMDNPLPRDVRTPATLQLTVQYLVNNVLMQHPLQNIHGFLRDRTRGIRQDFQFQNHKHGEAVYCHEVIGRFHILSLHRLCENSGFETFPEMEQLSKTLASLSEMYDIGYLDGEFYPNESEFRSYQIIAHASERDMERKVAKWPQGVQRSQEVQCALRFYRLLQWNSSWGTQEIVWNATFSFFHQVRSSKTPYLLGCLLEAHFGIVRRKGLDIICRNYLKYSEKVTMEFVRNRLGYESLGDVEKDWQEYKLPVVKKITDGKQNIFLLPGKAHAPDRLETTIKQRFHPLLVESKADSMSTANIVYGRNSNTSGVPCRSRLITLAKVESTQSLRVSRYLPHDFSSLTRFNEVPTTTIFSLDTASGNCSRIAFKDASCPNTLITLLRDYVNKSRVEEPVQPILSQSVLTSNGNNSFALAASSNNQVAHVKSLRNPIFVPTTDFSNSEAHCLTEHDIPVNLEHPNQEQTIDTRSVTWDLPSFIIGGCFEDCIVSTLADVDTAPSLDDQVAPTPLTVRDADPQHHLAVPPLEFTSPPTDLLVQPQMTISTQSAPLVSHIVETTPGLQLHRNMKEYSPGGTVEDLREEECDLNCFQAKHSDKVQEDDLNGENSKYWNNASQNTEATPPPHLADRKREDSILVSRQPVQIVENSEDYNMERKLERRLEAEARRNRLKNSSHEQWWPISKSEIPDDQIHTSVERVFKPMDTGLFFKGPVGHALRQSRNEVWRLLLHNNDWTKQSMFWWKHKFLGGEEDMEIDLGNGNIFKAQLATAERELEETGAIVFGCSPDYAYSSRDRYRKDREMLHLIVGRMFEKRSKLGVLVIAYRPPVDDGPVDPVKFTPDRETRINMIRDSLGFQDFDHRIVFKEVVLVETITDVDINADGHLRNLAEKSTAGVPTIKLIEQTLMHDCELQTEVKDYVLRKRRRLTTAIDESYEKWRARKTPRMKSYGVILPPRKIVSPYPSSKSACLLDEILARNI